MNHKEIHYGILSTASIVPRFVKGMRLTENGRICAVASRSEDKAKALAESLDIPGYYGDYRRILEDDTIDAVYIPALNSAHYPMAKDALLAGKHTLVEKPFVLQESQALELARIAEEKELFLTETVKTPHLPVFTRVKEIIGSGAYGRIRFMDFRQSYTEGPYISGWNKERKYGGGVLFGNEAYFFTMAEFLAGKAVSCTGTLSFGRYDAEDQCSVDLLLPDDVIARMAVSTDVLFDNGLTIYLTDGRIVIPDFWKASKAMFFKNGELTETLSFPCESEFVYELNHYNECILNGISFSPVTPVENTARYIGFCEQILKQY